MKKKISLLSSLLLICTSLFSMAPTYKPPPPSAEYALITPLYEVGMFSHFLTVLGFLEWYEQGKFKGVRIDFENRGLYHEPTIGSNWWEYYYEPISVGDEKNSKIKKFEWTECATSAYFAINLSRPRAYGLIQKYIKVKPSFRKIVDDFVDNQFKSKHIIGIHYRGTDKITSGEARFVSFQEMAQAAINLINEHQLQDYQIYVATDELNFLIFMIDYFGDRIIFSESTRSSNGQPLHTKKSTPYQTGKEALIDALLLSRCNYLIRTSSNLSLCSTYFNPFIPVKVIYGKKK